MNPMLLQDILFNLHQNVPLQIALFTYSTKPRGSVTKPRCYWLTPFTSGDRPGNVHHHQIRPCPIVESKQPVYSDSIHLGILCQNASTALSTASCQRVTQHFSSFPLESQFLHISAPATLRPSNLYDETLTRKAIQG